jgi:hypothetical protein
LLLPALPSGASNRDVGSARAQTPLPAAPQPDAAQAASTVLPVSLDAEVNAHPDWTRLRVVARLTFQVQDATEEVELELRPEVELDTVEDSSGIMLAYERGSDSISIRSPALVPGETVEWTFSYAVRLSRPLSELGGFYTANPWYPHLALPTQEDELSRSVPTVARISVHIPPPWVAVSSGRLEVERESREIRYVWTQQHRSPLHPLIVGRFRALENRSGGTLGRGFFSDEHAEVGEDLIRYALAVIEFYERALGPHDLADFSLVEATLPERVRGLTLPGLTILSRDSVDPSTPFPFRILAHEIGHNWWSILVEFPKRSDYWLREGLPTYSALMFLESTYGAEMMRQELRQIRRIALLADEAQPLSYSGDVRDRASASALNYHKAAFVLHMLRNVLGRERFEELLQKFSAAYADSTASTQEFQRLAEEIYGDDLGWFFAAWIKKGAVPRFEVRYEVLENADAATSTHRIVGSIRQLDAHAQAPALLRVRLLGAPPLEQVIWLGPGTTHFSIVCPAPPEALVFDPDDDLLHRGAEIVRLDSRQESR